MQKMQRTKTMQQRQKMKRAKRLNLSPCMSVHFLLISVPFCPFPCFFICFVFLPILFIFFCPSHSFSVCFYLFPFVSVHFHSFPFVSISFSPYLSIFAPKLFPAITSSELYHMICVWSNFDSKSNDANAVATLKSWTNKTKAAIADGRPCSKWKICDNPSSACPGFFLYCSPLLASWQATSLAASQLESRQEHFWRVQQSSPSSRLLLRVYLLRKSP